MPVAALGFGEPYALVLSSHWIEVFEDDELAFMVGRELGHIAAGHTRFLSLLSVNGNENPLISLIFGAWLRRCTFTCDKVGLLCCGSLDAAIRAMGVAAFHEFGRKIDYQAFAEQHAEIAEPIRFCAGASGWAATPTRRRASRRCATSSTSQRTSRQPKMVSPRTRRRAAGARRRRGRRRWSTATAPAGGAASPPSSIDVVVVLAIIRFAVIPASSSAST